MLEILDVAGNDVAGPVERSQHLVQRLREELAVRLRRPLEVHPGVPAGAHGVVEGSLEADQLGVLQGEPDGLGDGLRERVFRPLLQAAAEGLEAAGREPALELERGERLAVEGLADLPEPPALLAHLGALDHLVVEDVEVALDAFGLQLGEGGMHVAHALLDDSVVAHPEERLVLRHEALVVVEPLGKLAGHADDVPVVGELIGILRIEPDRAPAELIDGHGGCHCGEVDENVDAVGVPSLAE